VRIGHKPTEVRFLQCVQNARIERALGQPDTARIPAKTGAMKIACHHDLGAQGRRIVGQQRQQRVRGRAGRNFQQTVVLKSSKGCGQVLFVIKISLAQRDKALVVHSGQLAKSSIPMRAMHLAPRQFDQSV